MHDDQPRVHCPRCRRRYRLDPTRVRGRSHGLTVRCRDCRAGFRVREGADGSVEVIAPATPADPPVPSESAPGGDSAPAAPAGEASQEAPDAAGGLREGPAGGRRRARRRKRLLRPFPGERPARAAPRGEGPPLEIGERVGRYEIDALLGRGGMGAVYRAFDPAANRHVALKVLPADAPEGDRLRFEREVQVQGNIQHAHIMPIFDSGSIGGARWFTMELLKDPVGLHALVDGARSGQAARDPHLRPAATLEGLVRRIVLPVCEAIHHANVREGVLHRDLKPENVLVDRHGLRIFVIDFGVCSLLERKNARLAHLPAETPVRLQGGRIRVTGTLAYMPPEQARGETDRRGDVWALGALLHHVATGSPPVAPATKGTVPRAARLEGLRLLVEQARREGRLAESEDFARRLRELERWGERSIEDVQRDVLTGNYLARPAWLPAPLEAIIAKAMAMRPERRYRHAQELREDILAWLGGRPVKAVLEDAWGPHAFLYRGRLFLRRNRWAAALLLLAGLGGAWGAGSIVSSSRHPAVEAREAAAWLDRAREAAAQGDREGASRAVEAALGVGGDPSQALAILALARREADREDALQRARALALEARTALEQGEEARARDRMAALAEVIESRLTPGAAGASASVRAEVASLRRLARGDRLLRVHASGAEDVSVRLVPVAGPGGRIGWADVRPPEMGEDGPVVAPGTWILELTRGEGALWLPLRVEPGTDPLDVACPVDPASLPPATRYVPAGIVQGPLGREEVGALLWDATEVTAERYARFLESLPPEERARRVPRRGGALGLAGASLWAVRGEAFEPPAASLRRPVEGISVHDARAFADFEGKRLPTAAEWVWAATGGDGRATPAGPYDVLGEGLLRLDAPELGPGDVGLAGVDRSPFGLLDMAANVAEMTQTLGTVRGTNGYLVLGGGYLTSRGAALVTECTPQPGWKPLPGTGVRLVRPPPP